MGNQKERSENEKRQKRKKKNLNSNIPLVNNFKVKAREFSGSAMEQKLGKKKGLI